MSSSEESTPTVKRVSVVIPAYNAEAEIQTCVAALLNQTLSPTTFEIIVVDDGSSDNTLDVLARLPVRSIRQENQGPAGARNAGAAAANGEIIVFLDSDCVPNRDWLEQMLKPLDNDEVVGVCGAYRTSQTSRVARFVQFEFHERYRKLERKPFVDMVPSYAAAYRRETFIKAGGFLRELRMNEDVELSYRLSAEHGKLVFNPRAIVYHIHPATWAQYFKIKFGRGFWRFRAYQMFPHKAVSDTYTPQNLKIQVLSVYLLGLCLVLTPFAPQFLLVAGGVFVLACATMSKMCMEAVRTSPELSLFCLPLLWVRAIALALGTAAAAISSVRSAARLKFAGGKNATTDNSA